MKKIVSNILIVSTQLLVGGLFLLMLFSDNSENDTIVVVRNNNLDKMADSVSCLFDEDLSIVKPINENKVEELAPVVKEQSVIKDDEPVKEEKKEEKVESVVEEFKEEVVEEVSQPEETTQELIVVDPSGYISNVALGFTVTTDNKVYSLSDEEFNTLASKVACEAKVDRNDILAVISVILNRADRCYSGNCDPVSVVLQPNQFVCKPKTPSDTVIQVVTDALNGVRNNEYSSFRSWATSGYSDNYIVEGGNRYK